MQLSDTTVTDWLCESTALDLLKLTQARLTSLRIYLFLQPLHSVSQKSQIILCVC